MGGHAVRHTSMQLGGERAGPAFLGLSKLISTAMPSYMQGAGGHHERIDAGFSQSAHVASRRGSRRGQIGAERLVGQRTSTLEHSDHTGISAGQLRARVQNCARYLEVVEHFVARPTPCSQRVRKA